MNIALTGKFRSGKDAVAHHLALEHGYTQFAFGDELKRYYHELFGDAEEKPREGYQWFGQNMRERDPNIWVRKCFDDIVERQRSIAAKYANGGRWGATPPFRVVISDLRQPNEFDRCRAEGYTIIRVNCPDELRIERARAAGDAFKPEDLTHDTEQHVDTFAVDYEVQNDGTLDELYAQIDAIIAQ